MCGDKTSRGKACLQCKVGSPAVSEKAVGLGGRAVLVGVEDIVPDGTTSIVSVSWCI